MPNWKRVGALIVIFLIVIVFWMVFHQNSTTITYWGDENTDWNISGIISNAINPGWVIILTFPLVGFWKWLDTKGLEPSTPTKMVIGMVMTALAFFVFFIAAKVGEASVPPGADPYALGAYKVSPLWILGAYGVLTLGELMLSPMGLSLVSKVAPVHMRGLMMGGWFVATAIGNKLTQIGQLWDDWLHFELLDLPEWLRDRDGGRTADTSEATQEGDARRVTSARFAVKPFRTFA